MSTDIKQELIERYQATGKIGFIKPQSIEEAYSIIDTLSETYEIESTQPVEEVTISISELTQKLREFLDKF